MNKIPEELKTRLRANLNLQHGSRESDMCIFVSDRLSDHPIAKKLLDLRNKLGNFHEVTEKKNGRKWFAVLINQEDFAKEKLAMELEVIRLAKEVSKERFAKAEDWREPVRAFLIEEFGDMKTDENDTALYFGNNLSGLILSERGKLCRQMNFIEKPYRGFFTGQVQA